MAGLFEGWPLEAQVAVLTAALAAFAWPVKIAHQYFVSGAARSDKAHEQGWARAKECEGEIVELRKEMDRRTTSFWQIIDKGRRRETAYATGCELLLIAMPSEPTAEQVAIVKRAQQLFETALLHSDGEGGGGA